MIQKKSLNEQVNPVKKSKPKAKPKKKSSSKKKSE
tara:strand:+ start:389 stop:493 length:105 start_codon:yes stop_codon:yes gene_type:complete